MSDVLTHDEMKVGDKTTFGKTIGECDVCICRCHR